MESATDSAKREADRDTMAVEVERNRPTAAARRPPRILPAMFSKVTVPMRRFLGHHIFSSLTRRILFLNLAGLAVLVTGILYLNTFRDGLIDARVESLMTQGEIIAGNRRDRRHPHRSREIAGIAGRREHRPFRRPTRQS